MFSKDLIPQLDIGPYTHHTYKYQLLSLRCFTPDSKTCGGFAGSTVMCLREEIKKTLSTLVQ